jgi:hypothetical protein
VASTRRKFPSLFLGALAVAACSWVEPQVGPLKASCSVGSGGSNAGGEYGGGGAAQLCMPGAGSACDQCESASCCGTRVACLSDPTCACADQALEACQGDVMTDGGVTDRSSAAARCWDVFSGTGSLAQARAACQRASCQTVCAVP